MSRQSSHKRLDRNAQAIAEPKGGFGGRLDADRSANRALVLLHGSSSAPGFQRAILSVSLGAVLGSIAGMFIAFSDFGAAWLWLPLWKDRFGLLLRLITTHVPIGVILGITLGLVVFGADRSVTIVAKRFGFEENNVFNWICSALAASIGTTVVSPLVVWVALLLFTGGKMSKLPQRDLFEILAAISLLICVWLGFFLAHRSFTLLRQSAKAFFVVSCVGLLGLFFCFSKVDQLVLPTQYAYLHTTLTAVCWLLSFYLLAAAASRFVSHSRFEQRLPVIACFTALVAGLVLYWNAVTLDDNQNVRVALMDPRASHSRSIMLAIQPLLFGAETRGRDAISTAAARRARTLRQKQETAGELPALPDAHVLLISIDALRADHLGTYGYARATSPYLDALAKESIVFERAYTQVPHSSYSISSIMTSEYLHETVALGHPLPEATVATALNRARYHTAGFYTLGIFHTQGTRLKLYENKAYGFALHDHTDRDAEAMTDRVLKEIDRTVSRGEPSTFFWVHYFDVHEPYRKTTFGESDLDRYDSEILRVDSAVKRLIAQAKQRLKRDIIIGITADHGEEFREHGGVYHGSTLYDEQVRVPLIFHIPGFTPRRVQPPVELVDVAPTLLSLVEVTAPPSMRGDDLRPLMLGRANAIGPAFSSVIHKRMAVNWPYKLIADLRFNLYELYDLNKDRFERHNLADANRHVLESLRGEIYAWLDTLSQETQKEQDSQMAAIKRGRLGDRRAVQPLSDILYDEQAPTDHRIQAARILGDLSDPQATSSLLDALKSDNSLIAAEAAIALGRLFDKRALQPLRQLVVSEDPDIRSRAAVSLGRLRDRTAVPGLIDALWVAPNDYEKQEAVRWLGRLRDNRALEPLINLLPELRTRYLVVIAMGQIGDQRAFEPLADVLSWDTHPNVRDNVIRGFGLLGDTRAIDLILPVAANDPTMKNSSESLVRLDAIGLKAIGGTDGLKEKLGSLGFRRCYRGPLLHDWDYLHRTWCETATGSASLRLEVPKTVANSAYGSFAVLGIKRTDSEQPSQLRLSIERTEFEPVQVDGAWQEFRWPVDAGVLSAGAAKARIRCSDASARFAVDHLLLLPRTHERKERHGG
jgi:arylsulfatase A-like enzyme